MSWDDAIDGVDRETPGARVPRFRQVAWRLGQRDPRAGEAANDDDVLATDGLPAYAELHCLSEFSFLRGASSAEDLFARAAQCGYEALAITDECSLAGIVRAWEAARATGVKLVVGSELTLECGLRCVLLVQDRDGYTRLCELITIARRNATKGSYRLTRAELERVVGQACPLERPQDTAGSPSAHAGSRSGSADGKTRPASAEPDLLATAGRPARGHADCGLFALWLPGTDPDPAQGRWLQQVFGERAYLAVELHREQDDAARLSRLLELAAALRMRALAAGDVHMDVRRRRVLQDTLTAIRHNLTLDQCADRLFRNGERHLRSRRALAAIHPPALLQASVALARRCRFDLKEAAYRYPKELVPDGHTPSSWLRKLTEAGMRERWPQGTPPKVVAQIEEELALIAELKYEAFFLTVEDIVRFARSRNILCQGRGSSANSAVCFALGITAVDPTETRLLISRFLSKARDEPPDIDVDFEHERREEVLQYVYGKYGRRRAALAATVIRYRGKSAVRDVAKAFGLPPDQIGLLAECFGWGNGEAPMRQRLSEAGFDPDNPLINKILALAAMLEDMPRHLSQHVGGFVIADAPLSTVVPVENAAMADRTIIQWDKDDLETMGLLKVDCLALGMLTCIRKAFDLVEGYRGMRLDMAGLPRDDAATFAMLAAADSVGVFQVESRAQMAMLPRLQPRVFYDLVIEVAIVRPGPIQGDMVHPYLRRRTGEEPVSYPSPELEQVLERTLGVPLFQEQVMQIAMVAAGYDAGQADQLRRSMAAWKRHGGLEHHRERLIGGMLERGYELEFAERIFEQIKGFGNYGFPESHAASFALIAYASSWLKCHHQAEFACALVNSQPMGFYSADQLLQDARRHGVSVRPLDVRYSDWDCSLEPELDDRLAIRLGLRMLRGFRSEDAQRISQARARRAFSDVADLCHRAGLDARAQALLADAGALRALAGHRHRARWAIAGVEAQRPLFAGSPATVETQVALPLPTPGQDLVADYTLLGTTLERHPLSRLRSRLQAQRCRSSRELATLPSGRPVSVAGLVTGRQRPQTASGVTFVTLEDEFGMVNVVVWQQLAERQRRPFLEARLMRVDGRLESENGVVHVVARQLHDLTPLLGSLDVRSRDFH